MVYIIMHKTMLKMHYNIKKIEIIITQIHSYLI